MTSIDDDILDALRADCWSAGQLAHLLHRSRMGVDEALDRLKARGRIKPLKLLGLGEHGAPCIIYRRLARWERLDAERKALAA